MILLMLYLLNSFQFSSAIFILMVLVAYTTIYHNQSHNINQLHIIINHNMESIQPYLEIAHSYIVWGINTAQRQFNLFAQNVDFTAFCLLYTIVLIFILTKLKSTNPAWRPKNMQLVDWKTKTKLAFTTWLVSLPGIKQYVQRKFKKELEKAAEEFYESLEKERDPNKAKKLPAEGMNTKNIEARLTKWFQKEQEGMFTGKISGSIYPESYDHCKEVSDFAAKYMYHNPLHLDTYKEVSRMEAEVLKMTANLISKNRVYGVLTGGGSQSLIMSLYAYKTAAGKSRPNVVVPNTIHAALDKGCHYFNIQLRKVRLNDAFEADMEHMKSLVDSNTIAIYGSYGNYPHGIIDPIIEMGALAKKWGIGFHIDACLGGFVAGFLKEHQSLCSLDVQGATSISLDQHKFALAPKGVSTIFFKTNQLRHHMYFVYSDWLGGVYATPSFPGSRSGFASAGAWYSMTRVGRRTFVQNAMNVSNAVKKVSSDLSRIKGIKMYGNPTLCAFGFGFEQVDAFAVAQMLVKKKQWKISTIYNPKGIHVSVTPSNCQEIADNFAKDVEAVLRVVEKQPQKPSDTAMIYGASSAVPSEAMGEDLLKMLVSTMFR